jgi:virginiamycin B lyase
MPVRNIAAAIVAALASLSALCASAAAAPHFEAHYEVGQFSDNSKIVEGADHNMWLTIEDGGKDVARITPAGQVTEYTIKAAAAPLGIAAGPEGRLWITFNNHVASFLPADPEGSAEETEIADVSNQASIVAGPDGQMWVAAEKKLIHFKPSEPAAAQSIEVAEMSPKDIDVAGSVLAIAASIEGKNFVLTATTAGVITKFPIKGPSQGVAGNASGQIGFSQQGTMPTEVGVFTPPGTTPVTSEVPAVDPFGIALGSDTAFWAARKGGAQRFTASGESTFIAGADEKLFVRQIASGPDNTIWITMLNGGENVYEVGKISGLEPPVKPIPTGLPGSLRPDTKIDKGPKGKVRTKGKRASVKFRFSSTTAGATFECALVKKPVKKGKKAPKPKFRSCKSPKKLKLRPGRYRFSVRAVSAGLVDPTPATRSFRVVRVR